MLWNTNCCILRQSCRKIRRFIAKSGSVVSIIHKLTLSLFVLSFVVFGLYGAIHMRAEREELRLAMEQATRILASSLQVSVENALRDRQLEDVRELLQQLERIDPSIHIRVYIDDSRVMASDTNTHQDWPDSLEQTLQRIADKGETRLFYFPADKPAHIFLSLPFADAKTVTRGNLTVVRSLSVMNQDLRATERNILVALAAFVLVTSLLCLVLMRVYIARPLKRLGQGMRDFRDGTKPPEPLPVVGNDELAAVTREFNRMIAELTEAYRQLDESTQQRRRLQRALQEADKLIAIGQLSAGLAHEIGTPLQIVNGRARALAGCAETSADVRRAAEIMVAQTERITRIVQRLLDFVRRKPPEPVPCDTGAVIAEVLDMLRYEARRHAIDLRFTRPDRCLLALTHKDWLQQIVLNLVSNALAATDKGGTIIVDLREAVMRRTGEAVPALQLTVKDNGKGIASEHLPQLFEPFFTTRGERGGTGLGLAMVKSIVTEMGGTVAAESGLGLGSCFTVHFPLKECL